MSATACSRPLELQAEGRHCRADSDRGTKANRPPAGAEDAACASAGKGAARSAAPRTAAATIVGYWASIIGDLAVGSLFQT